MVPGLIEFWEQTLRDGEQAVKSSSHLGRRNSQGWKRVPLKPSTIPFTVTMILGWQLRILWPRGSLVSGAPQTTVCGIGERSGNAAFEEVCLGSGSYGRKTGIKTERIFDLPKWLRNTPGCQ